MVHCTKAIIPVAGYGTRRFPITKTIEKCMLPILNRPIIDYIVEDCIQAGVTDFYFVVNERATQLRDYYEPNPQLEAYLQHAGKEASIPVVQPPKNVRFNFIVQPTGFQDPHGTAIPVWLCRQYINPDEHVLVLMGDDFIYNPDGASAARQLIEAAQPNTSAMLGVEVPMREVSNYGVIATQTVDGAAHAAFQHIQEKPSVEEAQSNLINVSKYLLHPDFFSYLDNVVAQKQQGEYYITDALNNYVNGGNTMHVIPSKGKYLDGGTVEGWLAANNYMAKMAQAS